MILLMSQFSPLIQSLQSLFELEKPRAIDGKYIYTEIQHLKETTDKYHAEPSKSNFINLRKAIRNSMNYIEKWNLNFDEIKSSLDQEAKSHGMPPIDWPKYLSNSQASPKFQFSALNHGPTEVNLLDWLSSKKGKRYDELSLIEQGRLLVDNKSHSGFSKKLSEHLREDPDFLFNLTMKSKKIFTQFAKTSLILYLTDEQLAQAIIKYAPKLGTENVNYLNQVHAFIEKLNNTLTHGRSLSTVLRNAHAKAILDTSEFFHWYQNEDYSNQDMYSSVGWIDKSEIEGISFRS